ncbi:Uncharacterised protein [Brucella anthropi]|nr:Uncharacterised protein [Brucella anthropi]
MMRSGFRKEQECRNPHVERAAKLSGGPQIVPSAIENAVNRGVQLAVGLAPNTHFVILAQSVLFRGRRIFGRLATTSGAADDRNAPVPVFPEALPAIPAVTDGAPAFMRPIMGA